MRYLTLQFSRALMNLIKNTMRDLCGAMKPHAVDMVDSFGVPDFLLGEIGNDWLQSNACPSQIKTA